MSDSQSATAPHTDEHGHGHEGHHEDFLTHVKPYLWVGFTLFIFTVITVALAYVDFDKIFNSHGLNIKIGLAVATFKVLLVAAWFMHLKNERATIWRPLIFTLIFCAGLFAFCMLHYNDPIPTTTHTQH